MKQMVHGFFLVSLHKIFPVLTRIIPAREDTPESRIYYEFLDFYNATNINYLFFSKDD